MVCHSLLASLSSTSPLATRLPSVKDLLIVSESISRLSICPPSLFGLLPVPGCVSYCGLMVSLEVRSCSPPTVFFWFSNVLSLLGFVLLRVNFVIILSIPTK